MLAWVEPHADDRPVGVRQHVVALDQLEDEPEPERDAEDDHEAGGEQEPAELFAVEPLAQEAAQTWSADQPSLEGALLRRRVDRIGGDGPGGGQRVRPARGEDRDCDDDRDDHCTVALAGSTGATGATGWIASTSSGANASP